MRIRIQIDRKTMQLMRIPFSYYLMPIFLFALSQAEEINLKNAALSFIILHLFIYPASNGYNSYMDKDESSIGGLKKPPLPTKKLFFVSVLFDVTGLIVSLFVSLQFFISVLVYLLASRAYSYRGIRLKKMPFIGFLTVVFFQGAFTFWMVSSCVSHNNIPFDAKYIVLLIACSFLIAGVYPLTQVYQHEADVKSGDITISYKLGYKGTFIFTAFMFLCSNILLYYYFSSNEKMYYFFLLQLFLFPVLIYFFSWLTKVWKNYAHASFENAMRMNFIASTAMNLCFITLLIINQYFKF